MEGQPALLFAYAHPDDEQGITGSIMRYLAGGTQVGLICATRGEEGEIAPGVDATPENLGTVREAEMRAAMDVVGLPFLWFLDYRDSGMDGTESNKRPDSFVNAPPEEAVGRIVAIIREELVAVRDEFADQDTASDVRAALATLPFDQRAAIVLVDIEGYPVDDVAAMLQVPSGTVKSRCARGRAKLMPLLAHLHGVAPGNPGPAGGVEPPMTQQREDLR